MAERIRGGINPRDGSTDPEEWHPDLAWYFTEFDGECGFRSIGTSGAGENELVKPSKEETDERNARMRAGLVLTLPGAPKADLRTVSGVEADRGAVESMQRGVYQRGANIWRRLTRLPYSTQQLLRQAYMERTKLAGQDWGPPALDNAAIRRAHREYMDL